MGSGWATMVGPGELHIHCKHGIPAISWGSAARSPGNAEVLGKSIRGLFNDFHNNIATRTSTS